MIKIGLWLPWGRQEFDTGEKYGGELPSLVLHEAPSAQCGDA